MRFAFRCVAASSLVLVLSTSCHKQEQSPDPSEDLRIVQTKIGMDMVEIPAGRFLMGSEKGEEDERPVREVALGAFLMDTCEMTQQCYGKLVPANGSHFKGPDHPVEQISWAEAALFCNMRSRDEGLEPCYDEETAECNPMANGYRLPTEAEWEYACRAGTTTEYAFGNDSRDLKQHAWYDDNAMEKTHPVAQRKPNAWGLFDMAGNAAEWCNDIFDSEAYKNGGGDNPRGPSEGDKNVLRGGAWALSAQACRSAARVGEDPGFQDSCFARDIIGFRCVRNAPEPAGITE